MSWKVANVRTIMSQWYLLKEMIPAIIILVSSYEIFDLAGNPNPVYTIIKLSYISK